MKAILNQITPSKIFFWFFINYFLFDKKFFILFLFSPIISSFNLFLLYFCHNNIFFIFSIIKNNNCLYSKILFNLIILGWLITFNKKYIFFFGLIYSSLFSQSFACREKVIKVKICFNTLQKKDLYQNYFLFIDMVKNTKMVYPIKSKRK